MKTFKILVNGIVQGVGFRPNIIKQATQHNMWVEIANTPEGVVLLINCDTLNTATSFWEEVIKNLPPKAIVLESHIEEVAHKQIVTHRVFKSNSGFAGTKITPEMAWCSQCKKDFFDDTNRRHQFPFIACTDCGSRFSVMQSLPFERENTTHCYPQCEACQVEYDDAMGNRRAFSQLNACERCNFSSSVHAKEHLIYSEQIVHLQKKLKNGEIIAIKGIAGFLLSVDYRNEKALENLRIQKRRPYKPFAIMVQDIEFALDNFIISPTEKEALLSSAAPIVVLQPKSTFLAKTHLKLLSGYSNKVGVMLASSGFLYHICHSNDGAIVATSGNISGFPLEFKNETTIQHFSQYNATIWYYDREIIFPQDDSVVSFSPHFHQKILLRRAKGLSPSEILFPHYYFEFPVLALGAEMKSTISFAYQNQMLISPYLGKMTTVENGDRFVYYLKNILSLTKILPKVILIDQHPAFHYRNLIAQIPALSEVEVVEIQHHEAHFAALLGEYNLIESPHKILGCIADGMGYGEGNFILGGEFFLYEQYKITKVDQFPFFHYLLADRMSLEPRLSYFSIMGGEVSARYSANFSSSECATWSTILPKQPPTNSIGRVFDALAFVLGYAEKKQSYEGEAVQVLDGILESGYRTLGLDYQNRYILHPFSWKEVFIAIEHDLKNGCSQVEVAWKFIHTFVEEIFRVAEQQKVEHLAFSGGVFQNKFIVDLLLFNARIKNKIIYLHSMFSPNDENISVGQLIHYYSKKK